MRHQGHAVGAMMDRILKTHQDAPLINALTTGLDGIPGEGVADYINKKYLKNRKKQWADISDKKKKKIVSKIRQDVRSYPTWDKIYHELWGEDAIDNYPDEELNEGEGSKGSSGSVCLVSMTASSADETTRGMEFLFSLNRINVAVSRAKSLALVFGSSRLRDAKCNTVERMRLVNTLCALPTSNKLGHLRVHAGQ